MRRHPVATLSILLVAASSALAIVPSARAGTDPQSDGVGIYFDQAATQTWCSGGPLLPVTAYLIITHPDSPAGIAGVEVQVDIAGGFELGHFYAGGIMMVVDYWPCARPFWAVPLPPADAVVVATVQVMLLGAEIVEFRLGPCSPSVLPGMPAYSPGDRTAPRPLYVASGDFSLPVARINGEPVVPVAASTWGAVKGLYGR
ncbi:MAG: hypothetical protein ACYDIE_08590 [Candidatus Krumholzibacteriia bacterium]